MKRNKADKHLLKSSISHTMYKQKIHCIYHVGNCFICFLRRSKMHFLYLIFLIILSKYAYNDAHIHKEYIFQCLTIQTVCLLIAILNFIIVIFYCLYYLFKNRIHILYYINKKIHCINNEFVSKFNFRDCNLKVTYRWHLGHPIIRNKDNE